jgi:hypothetical protein
VCEARAARQENPKRKRTKRNTKDVKGESDGLGKGYDLECIFHKDPVLVVQTLGGEATLGMGALLQTARIEKLKEK